MNLHPLKCTIKPTTDKKERSSDGYLCMVGVARKKYRPKENKETKRAWA